MTSDVHRMGSQLKRSYEGGAWHGPSVLEAIEGVEWEQAFQKPVVGFHSICELILHIAAWAEVGARALNGDVYGSLPEEADWPDVGTPSEAAWEMAQKRCSAAQLKLRDSLRKYPDDELHEKLPGKEYSMNFLLQGILQHNVYHAGQIAVLKRAGLLNRK